MPPYQAMQLLHGLTNPPQTAILAFPVGPLRPNPVRVEVSLRWRSWRRKERAAGPRTTSSCSSVCSSESTSVRERGPYCSTEYTPRSISLVERRQSSFNVCSHIAAAVQANLKYGLRRSMGTVELEADNVLSTTVESWKEVSRKWSLSTG